MKRFSIFHPLYMSFYSAELYQDVGRKWKGVGLGYLFLAMALLQLPMAAKIHMSFTKWVATGAGEVVDKIPQINIRRGEVTTNVETPYFIPQPQDRANRLSPTAEYLAVIDLTGKYKTLEDVNADILLTRRALTVRNRPSEVRTYDLSQVQDFSMDAARVHGWLDASRLFVAPAFYVFVLVFSYLYRVVQVLLYAAIGILFARSLNAGLEYPALMRLAAVAVTPPMLLNEVVSLTQVNIPAWSLICLAMALGYLYFGIRSSGAPAPAPFATPAPPVGD
jgi:ABC-type sugar transport system permease subunit